MKKMALFLLILNLQGCFHKSPNFVGLHVVMIRKAYQEATQKLGQAYTEDQKDRENYLDFSSCSIVEMSKRDKQRRIIVS